MRGEAPVASSSAPPASRASLCSRGRDGGAGRPLGASPPPSREEITQALIRSLRDKRKLECPWCLIPPAVAAGSLAASVTARIQLPWQPRDLGGSEPIAVLMKNQELGNGCGLERRERGWALCGRPLPTCPHRLQAALLPPLAAQPR